MNQFMMAALTFAWLAILVMGWLGWQLLRQNGRMLLRLDELEQRLDELEFGEADEAVGLPVGSEAPDFELPDLAGKRRTLSQYRGRPVLLVFFNPGCGFCREMMPKLSAHLSEGAPRVPEFSRAQSQGLVELGPPIDGKPQLVLITTGEAEQSRQLFDEHKLDCPVLLQRESEVAAAYKANGTPSGYLISAEGKIASELAMGAEALLEIARESRSSQTSAIELSASNGHGDGQSLVTSAATSRFSNGSLVRSKIKRDGLKAGTVAPDFRLPRLDGRGDLALSDLRGRQVLLVFSSPGCGPCNALAPELEKFHREQKRRNGLLSPALSSKGGEGVGLGLAGSKSENVSVRGGLSPSLPRILLDRDFVRSSAGGEGKAKSSLEVVMISKGEPKENRAKVKEHGLTFPIVLQQQWEISRRYAMFATPIAYLIDEAGVIAREVAVGTDAILELMTTLVCSEAAA